MSLTPEDQAALNRLAHWITATTSAFCNDDARKILAAVERLTQENARLRAALEQVAKAQPEAVDLLRRHGYVFERFPRDLVKQPPTTDGERWEAMAFSLYTRIIEASDQATAALAEEKP